MRFLVGEELNDSIIKILKEPSPCCAVAFWGKGAEKGVSKKTKVICNLKMGGTNPYVIEKLIKRGCAIRQNDKLHAKVYIGIDRAVVTSANASANGLGLEGREQDQWIEAGIEIEATDQISKWFKRLWDKSVKISPRHIEEARTLWKTRRKQKPSVTSPGQLDFESDNMPVIGWCHEGDDDWEPNKLVIEKALGQKYSKAIHERIDWGIELEGDADRTTFAHSRWILIWYCDDEGNPHASKPKWAPKWTYVEGTNKGNEPIDDGFKYKSDGAWRQLLLAPAVFPPAPFEIDETFQRVFNELIAEERYAPLRQQNYKGGFFSKTRLKVMRRFWREIQGKYIIHK